MPKTRIGKVAYNVLIHEEEMKNKNKQFSDKEELLEQVEDESNSDELLENISKENDK